MPIPIVPEVADARAAAVFDLAALDFFTDFFTADDAADAPSARAGWADASEPEAASTAAVSRVTTVRIRHLLLVRSFPSNASATVDAPQRPRKFR
jgi:hypothetical protein